jgi:isopentenyl-diphosphate delta-isomerase type 1
MKQNLVDYDRVNVVNDRDEIIAHADKLVAHLGEAILHQAISLFLFKKNEINGFDLLIQKRSEQKIVAANQWGNTVCGNVAMGENHQQCLWRRLREELDINLTNNLRQQTQKVAVINYHVACNQTYSEREIDHIFALFLNRQQLADLSMTLNPLEVSEVAWVNWSSLSKKKHVQNLEFAPWLELFLNKEQITQALNRFLENLTIQSDKEN